MALPDPIPDNPTRWDEWRNYNSDDYYARLCLSFESNPSAEQIEDNCRKLLVWWQKKLPLKNQPSNPLAQMLRAGLDEAPAFLAEAKTKLLDPEARAAFDQILQDQLVAEGLSEFKKLLHFSIGDGKLREEDEARLFAQGNRLGLAEGAMQDAIETELARIGGARVAAVPPPPSAAPAAVVEKNPVEEFRRMLRLSRLCTDGEEMTDDQRDALCNMGESLGLSGGEAEDVIDEYLDEMSGMPAQPLPPLRAVTTATAASLRTSAVAVARPATVTPRKADTAPVVKEPLIQVTPATRANERQTYQNFTNGAGVEMRLVTSGSFLMGSAAPEAAPQEQPVTPVSISCFYMARHPITNAQFEKFDPTHASKRAPWADDSHPVVYVTSRAAEKFCTWLSAKMGKKYRLPTEAEWEYAARGIENRVFPWGEKFDSGSLANFADKRTNFAWSDPNIDDGYAETSPVGSYPRGASPFGIEDMAGNVFEWCLDCIEPYKGKEKLNPKGNLLGQKRIYRGGSWKSRASNLRASARNFNLPDYSSNDVGFRVVCECDG